jgi:hypothetical protein
MRDFRRRCGVSMPSYQVTASKVGADGKTELCASREFEASGTGAAMAAADAWSTSESVISSGPTSIRLYAGKVLLCERELPDGIWKP